MTQPMKLKAVEEADVKVLSMLMQDALLPVKGLSYHRQSQCLAVLGMRYRWEEPNAQERVYTGVAFSGIQEVTYRGFDQGAHNHHMLNLLMIDASHPHQLRLVCSGEAEILLTHGGAYTIHLEDMSETWPGASTPHHNVI